MRYTGYTSVERVDDILDKIYKYGISSITVLEKDFLDAYSIGDSAEIHNQIIKEESERVFEDDNGYFKFEYQETKDYGDEIHYIGTLYVPDLKLKKGKKVEGRLEGRIVLFKNGCVSPNFFKPINKDLTYDIFEFCNSLEYELDSFLDYVVREIYEKEDF